jgi:hypothetical protein
MCPSEYGGLFVKIAILAWSASTAQFRDYGTASGRTYTYRLVGVDSSGDTADSDSISGSQMLSQAIIHAHHKNYQVTGTLASNSDIALPLNDLAPLQNVRSVNTVTRLPVSSSKPRVSMGTIERNVTTVPIWMPLTNASRSTLRAIYESIYYVCLRTTVPSLGKLFGTITAPREVYSGVTAGIACEFTTCQFSESVA